jgi:hypothetical protein
LHACARLARAEVEKFLAYRTIGYFFSDAKMDRSGSLRRPMPRPKYAHHGGSASLVEHDAGMGGPADPRAHDPSRGGVDHKGDVDKACPCCDVCEVRDPQHVCPSGTESDTQSPAKLNPLRALCCPTTVGHHANFTIGRTTYRLADQSAGLGRPCWLVLTRM